MTLFFLALALSHKLMSMSLPIFLLPHLGLLSGVKPHSYVLALVIPYSGNPKVRYDIVFSLGPFYINKKKCCYPCFLLTSKGDFGVKAPPQNVPAIHFRDTDGTSNQPMGSNMLALLT